jgi:hypothetical protein
MDGFANAQVSTASANIARHGIINILVSWIWIFPEKNRLLT